MQIAIDGPIAAGKGTVAKLTAEKLGFLYVDTGAMYRAISVFCDWHQVDKTDQAAVCALIAQYQPKLELRPPAPAEQDGRLCMVILDGKDVSWEIRSEESSMGSSLVSKYLCVRDYLLSRGQNPTFDQVLKELNYRDNQDATRPLRPLKKAAGAVEIDTSDMTIEEVVEKITSLAKQKL